MGALATALSERQCTVLLVGMGVTNRAVATALIDRGHCVVAVDDHVDEELTKAMEILGIRLAPAPGPESLVALVADADMVCPAPGLAESHPVFTSARAAGRPLVSEFDLAAAWDQRPIAAVTGTNGKTTVVELAADSLRRSGIGAVVAGNTNVPLVTAIDDPDGEVFVVEASSFRLARAHDFAPLVGTWLNFAPDHLDIHSDLKSYQDAKAALFSLVSDDGLVVANRSDPVVMSRVPSDRTLVTFGATDADWRVEGDELVGPDGPFTSIDRLWRDLPHDLENALAAAATVSPLGGTGESIAAACEHFEGLDHRVTPVATIDSSTYYDDSKATTPHATLAALRGFKSVVLIAGGRNKGIDLSQLAAEAGHVAAVVAIGEAAEEVRSAFSATHRVVVAADMDQAVRLARGLAVGGIPVLLSPGCASFDWYPNYGARGDDFARAVSEAGSESR